MDVLNVYITWHSVGEGCDNVYDEHLYDNLSFRFSSMVCRSDMFYSIDLFSSKFAARILPLYSLWIVNGDIKGRSEEFGNFFLVWKDRVQKGRGE